MYDLKIRQNLDCFAKTPRGGCKALKRKENCLYCSFYKPVRDQELDQKRAIERLKSLDKATRLGITEKYGLEGIV